MGQVCFRADTDMGLKLTLKDTVPAEAAVLVDSVSDAVEHFYLPPVFENGGRYCFGFRHRLCRLRRLRGCFALYLGCY